MTTARASEELALGLFDVPRRQVAEARQQGLIAIYALGDPNTGQIRYIGKSTDPHRRYAEHLFSKADFPVCRWVRKLDQTDYAPSCVVIQFVPEAEWEAWEQYWILIGRAHGWPLLNVTSGGRTMSPRWASYERRQRETGYYQSEKWRAISAAGGRAIKGIRRMNRAMTWATCSCGYVAHHTAARGHAQRRCHEVVSTWCWAAPELRGARYPRDVPADTLTKRTSQS